MRERVSKLVIESTPEDGTTVTAKVPVVYKNERSRLTVEALPTL
jgi:hypothetical protein